MKEIKLTDVGQLRNELARYKKGKKLDIRHFNQVARLAWLGKIVLSPLDPQDPGCRAYLLYMHPLDGLAAQLITLDEDLGGMPFTSQIHILDAEQGARLAEIFRAGMQGRVNRLEALNARDFYFENFFDQDDDER